MMSQTWSVSWPHPALPLGLPLLWTSSGKIRYTIPMARLTALAVHDSELTHVWNYCNPSKTEFWAGIVLHLHNVHWLQGFTILWLNWHARLLFCGGACSNRLLLQHTQRDEHSWWSSTTAWCKLQLLYYQSWVISVGIFISKAWHDFCTYASMTFMNWSSSSEAYIILSSSIFQKSMGGLWGAHARYIMPGSLHLSELTAVVCRNIMKHIAQQLCIICSLLNSTDMKTPVWKGDDRKAEGICTDCPRCTISLLLIFFTCKRPFQAKSVVHSVKRTSGLSRTHWIELLASLQGMSCWS